MKGSGAGGRIAGLAALLFLTALVNPLILLVPPLGALFLWGDSRVGMRIVGGAGLAGVLLSAGEGGAFLLAVFPVAGSLLWMALLHGVRGLPEAEGILASLVGGAALTGLVEREVLPGAFRALGEEMRRTLLQGGERGLATLRAMGGTVDAEQTRALARWVAEGVSYLLPAFLLIAGLVSFLLALTLFRRLGRSRHRLPEEVPLRQFRFNDQAVWALIGALAILLLPTGGLVRRGAACLLAVIAALIWARGLGVLAHLLRGRLEPAGLRAGLVGALFLLLPPAGVAIGVALGLADIWLDLRRRGQPGGA